MGCEFFAANAYRCFFSPSLPTSQNPQFELSWMRALRSLGRGLFIFMPLLCAVSAFPADVTIGWEPNQESDLEGYGVYFKKGAPGPPYDLFGNVALQELSDPENPTFTVTDLATGTRYYIALTAYDTTGNESDYSDPICAQIGDQILPCPSADDSGTADEDASEDSGSSSGGGGTACFIETASGPRNNP